MFTHTENIFIYTVCTTPAYFFCTSHTVQNTKKTVQHWTYQDYLAAHHKIIFKYGGHPVIPQMHTNFVILNETACMLLIFGFLIEFMKNFMFVVLKST